MKIKKIRGRKIDKEMFLFIFTEPKQHQDLIKPCHLSYPLKSKTILSWLEKEKRCVCTLSAELTGTFLKREWIRSDGERECGAKFNEALQFLLR